MLGVLRVSKQVDAGEDRLIQARPRKCFGPKESPVKGLAYGIANRMTDEEQQAATKAIAEEAINIAAKSKGIAEGDTRFLMHLIKASALEEVAVNVQTAIQVKEREMKQAKKHRTAKQAKLGILSKLAQKEIHKAERQGHAERIPEKS